MTITNYKLQGKIYAHSRKNKKQELDQMCRNVNESDPIFNSVCILQEKQLQPGDGPGGGGLAGLP